MILAYTLLIFFLSVTDIFLYRIELLPAEPSLTLLPLFFTLILFRDFDKFTLLKRIRGFNPFLVFLGISILFVRFDEIATSVYVIGNHLITLVLFFTTGLFFIKCNPYIILRVFLFSFLILGGSILNDVLFSQNNGLIDTSLRGAGFAENANNASLRIVFLMIGILKFLENKRYIFIIVLLAFIFVLLTLSRSSIIILAVAVVVLLPFKFLFLKKIRQLPYKFIRALPLILIAFYFLSQILIILPKIIPAFEHRAAIERIDQISGKLDLVSDSDLEGGRIVIFKDYFDIFLDNILGYGTGFSLNRDFYEKSSHNLFLRHAIDYGIVGVVCLIIFFYRYFYKSLDRDDIYLFTFILCSSIACFFTQSLFENRTFVIIFSFLVLNASKSKIYSIE